MPSSRVCSVCLAGRPGAAHQLFNSLPAIMTEVERYAPNQLAAVRLKSAEFGRALDPSAAAWQKIRGTEAEGLCRRSA